MNCDANEDLCDEDRWDIEGLPAVKVMRGGKGGPVHDYNGPRRAPDIVAFMRQVCLACPLHVCLVVCGGVYENSHENGRRDLRA